MVCVRVRVCVCVCVCEREREMYVVSAGVLSMDELVIAVVLSKPFSSFFSFVQRAELWYILEVWAK